MFCAKGLISLSPSRGLRFPLFLPSVAFDAPDITNAKLYLSKLKQKGCVSTESLW